jgi:glyoxylase-like metal-dependent hydrolase (beta-lactamase superfamily II)
VTQRGVVQVDVPEPLPFRPPLQVLPAIAEISDKPITRLIYSHAHSDHIGGAGTVVEAFPGRQDHRPQAHEGNPGASETTRVARRHIRPSRKTCISTSAENGSS